MKYNIVIQNERIFAKDCSKIDTKVLQNIFEKIEQMKKEGIINTQVKRLKNYPVADFRIRVGNYRILFNFSLENRQITLLRILHRSKLY